MPLLNRAGTIIEATTISNAAVDAGGTPLIPLADWHPAGGAGLLLEVDDEPQLSFAVAPLIAINFPSFNDGRGLSLAVLLRTRVGFEGELRVGDVARASRGASDAFVMRLDP